MFSDLIERLEKATGPDRDLDRAIWFGITNHAPFTPEYTASIDAALTLLPEGCEWALFGERSLFRAEVGDPLLRMESELMPTPAIALCIAALKAKAALPQERT